MRQLRVLRWVGSVAVAILSWVLAGRLLGSALNHSHVLAGGGPAVPHVHGPALLTAALSVVMTCLAGILLVALATGAGRSKDRTTVTTESPVQDAAGGTRATWSAAVTVAASCLGVSAVVSAVAHLRGGGTVAVPHPAVLVTLALVQAAVAGLAELVWQWCVRITWSWGCRRVAGGVVPSLAACPTPGAPVVRLTGSADRTRSGRGPPWRTAALRHPDLFEPLPLTSG